MTQERNYKSLEEMDNHFVNMAKGAPKVPTAVIAGHFPVVNRKYAGTDPEDALGIFPERTFETGCKIVNDSKKQGGNTKLVLTCDDHSQTDDPDWFLTRNRNRQSFTADRVRKEVLSFYDNFRLPPNYLNIMDNYEITKKDFQRGIGISLRSNSDSHLLFPESTLKSSTHFDEARTPSETHDRLITQLDVRGFKKILALLPQEYLEDTQEVIKSREEFERQLGRGLRESFSYAYLPTGNKLDTPEKLEQAANEELGGIHVKTWG